MYSTRNQSDTDRFLLCVIAYALKSRIVECLAWFPLSFAAILHSRWNRFKYHRFFASPFFRFFFLSGVSSVTNNAFYSSELILELQSVASLVSSFFLFYSIKKDHWKRCIGLKDFVVSRLILRVIPYIRPVPEVREGVVWLRTPSCLSMYVCVCACVVSVFLCVRIWTPIPRAESPRTGLARAWA